MPIPQLRSLWRNAALVALLGLFTFVYGAGGRTGRYALLLSNPAVAQKTAGRGQFSTQAALQQRATIQAAQAGVRRRLAAAGIKVTGSVQILLNAIFVEATPDRLPELRALPGVEHVAFLPRVHRSLDAAVPLMRAPEAWNALGGIQNAGLGMKIAILDTGIDQTHPAFRDDSLPVPAGFPKCDGSDCAFTNRKVIAARSYVSTLGAGTPPTPAVDSRPDDTSPRDHIGHGTALAMSAGGMTNTGPAATITGMAPKAFLGNYKIFGSPGVNDFSGGDVIIMALEQALFDGMDIAVLSLGSPAFTGPLDTGAACGAGLGTPCDPEAQAVENAVASGMAVVVAAGNEGDIGNQVPTRGTVDSPGTAPSAITVGASTNSHVFINSVTVPGAGVPAGIQQIMAVFGTGPLPSGKLIAPLRDVAALGNDGLACQALPLQSLDGALALVQRGQCTFEIKVRNSTNAGAVGVIIYQQANTEDLFAPGGLEGTNIPAVMIGYNEGIQLKTFLETNPDHLAALDPTLVEAPHSATADQMAGFSSRGPAIGTGAIKPDLVAVGTELYMATQSFDPLGALYDPTGYVVAQGTSFSTPLVAGAVALVKQAHPQFSPAQLKSAVVNTASQAVTENGSQADTTAGGGGRLDAAAAVANGITIEPASLSFGVIGQTALPIRQTLQVTNTAGTPVNLSFAIMPLNASLSAQLTLDTANVALGPGQSRVVTATLSGVQPAAGLYDGVVTVQGGPVALHVPYLYSVPSDIPFDVVPLIGQGFFGTVGKLVPDGGIVFKLIDESGLPVAGVPVQFSVTRGGGEIRNADTQTDVNGLAGAEAHLGPTPGPQQFRAQAGSLSVTFDGEARVQPAIANNGVVNAASFAAGTAVAPGSYISIFGTGLSDDTQPATTASLPLSIADVSVSFDVPSAGLSLPGRLIFVSPGQVNLQVPWELRGQSSAQVKVTIGDSLGQVSSVPLADYAPGVFEYAEAAGTRLAAALKTDMSVIGTGNPAQRGQTVSLFANGLGPVDNAPATGEPAQASPLSNTLATVAVTIGGKPVSVGFSGLAPGFPALYQLNVTVPPDTPVGVQPVVVTVNGVSSPPVMLPVQ